MTAHDGNQGMNQSGQPGPAELSESRYSGAGILLGWKSRECWEVLLAKRGEEPFLGYWSVPGGGRSHSDPSPLATALREASEELFQGRDILNQLSKWLSNGFLPETMPIQRHATPRGNPWRTYLLELSARPPVEVFDVLRHEVEQVAWFRVSSLPALLHPCVVSSLEHFNLISGHPGNPS